MAARKYYLDDLGLIRVLQYISGAINDKTSSKVTFTETQNQETGEVTRELNNPNNFATIGAVHDYVANLSRQTLTINKESAVPDDDGYNIQNNTFEYNGSNPAQIDFNLISLIDILQLFIN